MHLHHVIILAAIIAAVAVCFGGGNLAGMRNALRHFTDSLEKRPGE